MKRVLQALEPVREEVGRVGLVGHGWGTSPPWANSSIIEDAYYSDAEYLRQMKIEVEPPISFGQVIQHMSRGIFHPVIYRPLFNHLRLVTCRTFETPAANTIPLFGLEESYVGELYGARALELVLPERGAEDKILDVLDRPEYYAGIVCEIRRRLATEYSYAASLEKLIEIVKN